MVEHQLCGSLEIWYNQGIVLLTGFLSNPEISLDSISILYVSFPSTSSTFRFSSFSLLPVVFDHHQLFLDHLLSGQITCLGT